MSMSNDKILQPMAGMTLEEMQDAVTALGMPRFVAKQLAQWIYQKRVNSFDEMHNVARSSSGIKTDSTERPSPASNRYFTVPSSLAIAWLGGYRPTQ